MLIETLLLKLPLFSYWKKLVDNCIRDKDTNYRVVKLVPNRISYSRIYLAPPIALALFVCFKIPMPELFFAAFLGWIWVFGFVIYGDRIDGIIARRCKTDSLFGKLLDATADKVILVAVVISMIALIRNVLSLSQLGFSVFSFWYLACTEVTLVLLAILGLFVKKKFKDIRVGSNSFGKIKYTVEIVGSIIVLAMLAIVTHSSFDASFLLIKTINSSLVLSSIFASLSIIFHIKDIIPAFRRTY